jgi:hypothetical protein
MRCIVAWILVGLMLHACVGCASLPPEERRGQELAVVGIAALTVGGIVLAKSLAHSNSVQVQQMRNPTTRTVLGPP